MRRCALAALPALLAVSAAPCDIYGAAGFPCVAAHSLTRALYAAFGGALYQVRRSSDNATQDIFVRAPGGAADAARQDAFCAGAAFCGVSAIYDQSPRANHLLTAPGGGAAPRPDRPVNASRLRVTLGGGAAAVYGAFFEGGQGYRIDYSAGVAKGNEPETLWVRACARARAARQRWTRRRARKIVLLSLSHRPAAARSSPLFLQVHGNLGHARQRRLLLRLRQR